MKTPTKFSFALVALALVPVLVPINAAAFSPRPGIRVAPVTGPVFEVIASGVGSGGGSVYWCGASEYARLVLGAGWNTKIYIARGLGPSATTDRRSAVHFTTDPAAAGITATGPFKTRNSLNTGESMSVQRGHLLCETNLVRD